MPRLLACLLAKICLLVLPLALLLLLQWPLRDGLGAYSREANDTAQAIFALAHQKAAGRFVHRLCPRSWSFWVAFIGSPSLGGRRSRSAGDVRNFARL